MPMMPQLVAMNRNCSRTVKSVAYACDPIGGEMARRVSRHRSSRWLPPSETVPKVGRSSPAKMRNNVVLPDPFCPSTASAVPALTFAVTGASRTSPSTDALT
ncbi:MAG TPA: hypothetical protein VIJ18_02145 [Microbacteriaceae bacterium]